MNTEQKKLIRSVDAARHFPTNTCPASRHVQMMGEYLIKDKKYEMLSDEPAHCGESLLYTVKALYEARAALAALRSMPAEPEPEPIAWILTNGELTNSSMKVAAHAYQGNEATPLYEHPQTVPKGVLLAIKNAGLTLVKTQRGYQLLNIGKVVAQ